MVTTTGYLRALAIAAAAALLAFGLMAVTTGQDQSADAQEQNCHPSYVPCVPLAIDVDCSTDANGPVYIDYAVWVIGPDNQYQLDDDNDGIGCDVYGEPTVPNPNAAQCHPNYEPCVPIADDVDCLGGGGDGPEFIDFEVVVIGEDPYELDGDGDGIGCEDAEQPEPTPTETPEPTCHPSYEPCLPIAVDADCLGGGGDGPIFVDIPVTVVGPDEYELDGDGDGIGCEAEEAPAPQPSPPSASPASTT